MNPITSAAVLMVCASILAASACGLGQTAHEKPARTGATGSETAAATAANGRSPSAGNARSPTIVAAGDIADCHSEDDRATAELVDGIDGTVLALGDEAYDRGSTSNYESCYEPTWGRFKNRTKPVPGNHEYLTKRARGYFGYYGAAAGDPGKGYYSYDLGRWHLVALNSNCKAIGGCGADSPQVRWLRDDLAANGERCTLAYWHHPRFSSGEEHGSTPEVGPLWEALYDADADVVLSAHEHNYERFAPQDPGAKADPERGIREFVIGTGGGGEENYPIVNPIANSEVRDDGTDGVLELTLRDNGYGWRFVPVAGKTFADSGSAGCH